MKTGHARWIKAVLLAPLLAVYGGNACTADAVRYAASELEDVANEMDGQDQDVDLGDYLADLMEDF